ncbi:fructosamine kinase family protein [Aliikangiella maris]|uniref:Fructosamine kinase family protein n=2 Tax=Aliikangiella maris TaxID=3162458 RepID=A0ABV3MKJ5_9GAMM
MAEVEQSRIEILKMIPISGGDINQAFRIKTATRDYFIKLNSSMCYSMLACEADNIALIAKTRQIQIPKVLVSGVIENYSFIILPFIDMQSSGDKALFGKQLAKLHQNYGEKFGGIGDNYIGLTPQINRPCASWAEFFSQHRIAFQLNLLTQKNVNCRLLNKGNQLMASIPEMLRQRNCRPSLIHGDLWSGNYAFDLAGQPVIYDPACYYADHEAELAMLELFGSPGKAFFNAYQQIMPIEKGYAQRKYLYNLYHILNHANLFGGGYLSQAESVIDSLLAVQWDELSTSG